MSLLDRVSGRRTGHDGRSGARIERGLLDGWQPVYVKSSPLEVDLAALVTGTALRERDLLSAGVFSSLPAGMGTALLAVEEAGEEVVTVSRDVAGAMLGWERVLDRAEVRRIFSAVSAMHSAFAGHPPPGLCPLAVRLNLLGPQHLDAARAASPGLASAIARGWDLFFELVPSDVGEAVAACQADPARLASALRLGAPDTLVHGDLWVVNMALEEHQVTLLDWGLATAGPGVLDLVAFCAGAMSNVALGREDLLAEARSACRDSTDDDTFALAEFWALLELGWNKALDAVDNPDPSKLATEAADLAFWVSRARAGIDRLAAVV